MKSSQFGIQNLQDFDRIIKLIQRLPDLAEDIINEYLWNEGAPLSIESIKIEMPKGSRDNKKYKGQPRTHAKESDSLTFEKNNLGFTIKNTNHPNFSYLMFPLLGIGNSYKNKPNDFMNRGIEKQISTMNDGLIAKLTEEIQKNL